MDLLRGKLAPDGHQDDDETMVKIGGCQRGRVSSMCLLSFPTIGSCQNDGVNFAENSLRFL